MANALDSYTLQWVVNLCRVNEKLLHKYCSDQILRNSIKALSVDEQAELLQGIGKAKAMKELGDEIFSVSVDSLEAEEKKW